MTATAEPRGKGNGHYMWRGSRLEWWSATDRFYQYGDRRYRVYQRGAETCPVEVSFAAAETLADNARAAEALLRGDAPPQPAAALSLRQRIGLEVATRDWLNDAATRYHYMHRPIHDRAMPFGWRVTWGGADARPDGQPFGFIIFCSIHYTRLAGEFGYPGLPTKWQVLSLARLWLHDDLPRNSETCVIGKALKLVQRRWLEVHPPVFPDEPYHILKIVSYADTRFHRGTIYEAANFRFTGEAVSRRRHENSRDEGMDGAVLRRFIYDLPAPKWKWQPAAAQLALWERLDAASE